MGNLRLAFKEFDKSKEDEDYPDLVEFKKDPEIELQKPIIENDETIIEQQPQPITAQQFD